MPTRPVCSLSLRKSCSYISPDNQYVKRNQESNERDADVDDAHTAQEVALALA